MFNNVLVPVNIVYAAAAPSLPPSVPPRFYLPSYLLPSKSAPSSLLFCLYTCLYLFIRLPSPGFQKSFPSSLSLLYISSLSSTSTGIIFLSPLQLHLSDGLPAFPFQPFIRRHSVAYVVVMEEVNKHSQSQGS